MKEKTGIYIPLVTPFLADGEVDYVGLAKATKFAVAKGVDGIYAVGGTSEFCMLSVEERKKCLEVIIANADGAEIIAHVGAPSTRDAVELAKHAEKAGANMLSAVAPYYFGYSYPQIKEYFTKIAHATSLELMIYNAAQARTYSLDEMRDLLSDDKISAIKYTGYNFYFLERLIKEFPNKLFYTGADECFLAGQAVGAHGAIGTTYNVSAESYVKARKLFKEGKNAEALKEINKANDLTEVLISGEGLIAGVKYVMGLQGLDILPLAREPFSPLSDAYKARLKEAYEKYSK